MKGKTQQNIDADDTIMVNKIHEYKEGSHKGTIVDVQRNEKGGYDYIDIVIETEDIKGEIGSISQGFPTNISKVSKLGQFLLKAGFDLEVESISMRGMKDGLVGKELQFTTFNEETENGVFARIVPESMKLK